MYEVHEHFKPLKAKIHWQLVQAEAQDLNILKAMNTSSEIREMQKELQNDRTFCFLARHGKEFISQGIVTIGPGNIHLPGNKRQFPIKKEEAYLHYGKTLKNYQRQGVSSSLVSNIILKLHTHFSIKRFFVGVSGNNRASRHQMNKFGFILLQKFSQFNLLGAVVTRHVQMKTNT
ncbi:MAG: GNAT family N-acetyltransferase [Candidatus Hodarchaeota archaeon]